MKPREAQETRTRAKVYLKRIDSYSKTGEISSTARELAERIQKEEKILDFAKPVPIKVHFGEDGCITFIEPKNFDGLMGWLAKNLKAKKGAYPPAFFTDTNALYKGSRTTREEHLKIGKEHGFTQLPIIIADGEAGEENAQIDICKSGAKHFKTCTIGKAIADNSQLLVLAHFKGHMEAGFGGAIKQLGMGCAARSGKLAMHAHSRPIINPLQCKKCHTCANNCPTGACIINAIPHIDTKKCIGCARCIAVCPTGAVHVNWLSTGPKEFREKLAEYALAAQQGKKAIYINFIFNITKECDCMGTKQKPIAKDLGIAASTDPAALDKACFDLLAQREGKKMFKGDEIFAYAQKIGLGSQKYELVEM